MKFNAISRTLSDGLVFALLLFSAQNLSGAPWTIDTADAQGDVGYQSAIALDAYTHIIYSDNANNRVKYARKDQNGWKTETIPGPGTGGCSIALDSNGAPNVCYTGVSGNVQFVKYAVKNGGSWTVEDVETSGGIVFIGTSITIDSNGKIHVSYRGGTQLKYASKTTGPWTVSVVDGGAPLNKNVGAHSSIAVDAAGNPRISYYNFTDHCLGYAGWTGSTWLKDTPDFDVDLGTWTSLAIDKNNNPHISYYDNHHLTLKYTTSTSWGNWIYTATAGRGENVDTQAFPSSTSLVVDANGVPHIAYQAGPPPNLQLRYATRTGPGAWTKEVVDTGGAGSGASVKIGVTGAPNISYAFLAPSSRPSAILKFAHPTNSTKPCFIATAAYGSALDPHVKDLRAFRDRQLLNNPLGREFVRLYENVSPPLALFISQHQSARVGARMLLAPIVFAVAYPIFSLLMVMTVILGIVCFHLGFHTKFMERFSYGRKIN